IPIIADDYVDQAYGTGALKVTPGHDHNDFQIGQRHGLPVIKAIDEKGILTAAAGPYAGLGLDEARRRTAADLSERGLLAKVEPLSHAVGVCYRCQTTVEPLVSRQWFVKTTGLAQKAKEAVLDGRTRFYPASWEKTYFDWLDNIRDWCVSRQLWWGHRIPAWRCEACGQTTVSREDPDRCPKCQGGPLTQDPDVLDTWFSSALWPFSTLGWPEATADYARYYPTTVLVTGFDIIFFWVARMMMMGLWATGQAPFRAVVLHPLVRDAKGQKMSKSKGNAIDPLVVVDEHGADAFRLTLAAQTGQGRDLKLSASRVAGYGKFVNKLWNAARFVLTNLGEERLEEGPAGFKAPISDASLPDRWIKSRLGRVAAQARAHLEGFAFDRLADAIYHFVWDEFCDWYLELVKPILFGQDQKAIKATRESLLSALAEVLALAHPIIPFVTEEIWAKIPGASGFLMKRAYPGADGREPDLAAEAQIGFLTDVVKAVRSSRADFGVPPGAKVAPLARVEDPTLLALLREYAPILLRLMGADSLTAAPEGAVKPRDAAFTVLAWGEVWTPLGGHVDLTVEAGRLNKEADQLAKDLAKAKGKLANPQYVAKAPAEVVEETRERVAEMEARAKAVAKSLAALKDMAP
ncbi:MAG: valine--tRNA ligase, partial [Deltaproteobacteria bacterium]|nr:valine--tRNA ligase [Deltaproteobacteria bacterium]